MPSSYAVSTQPTHSLANGNESLNNIYWPLFREELWSRAQVNQFTVSPIQAQRVPEVWGSQISRQAAHKACKFIGPTQRPPLPPGNIPRTHFCEESESNLMVKVRPES